MALASCWIGGELIYILHSPASLAGLGGEDRHTSSRRGEHGGGTGRHHTCGSGKIMEELKLPKTALLYLRSGAH
jgi:hypothetical protein